MLIPTSSTGLGSWFHDPDIAVPFHVNLGYHGPQLLQEILTALDLCIQVLEFCPLTVGRWWDLGRAGPGGRWEDRTKEDIAPSPGPWFNHHMAFPLESHMVLS